ncbi:hypothetical protein GCM10027432_18110 [Lysobacter fragariae]
MLASITVVAMLLSQVLLASACLLRGALVLHATQCILLLLALPRLVGALLCGTLLLDACLLLAILRRLLFALSLHRRPCGRLLFAVSLLS